MDLCQRGEIFDLWSGTWRGRFYNMGLTQFATGCVCGGVCDVIELI